MITYSSCLDSELVALLKQGDAASYAEIYNRYWDKLYYISHKLLKDQQSAEEVVQDVFILIWNKCASAMVRYEVYRYLAKDKKHKEHETSYFKALPDQLTIGEDLENKLLLEIINELSNQLPEKCRLVFQYVKLQDKSIAQTAEELNISQKTAEAHLTKALKTIRGNMGNAMHLLF